MKSRMLLVTGALAVMPFFSSGCGDSSSSTLTSPDVAPTLKGGKGAEDTGGAHVRSQIDIPGHFRMETEAEGCYNNRGPQITLRGELSLGGLNGMLIFRNNRKGTHEHEEEATASVVLLEEGEVISFAKQPSLGGVGGNPWIYLELLDGRNRAISEEALLGRCVQGFMRTDMDLLMDGLAEADVSTADCSNSPGPQISIDGDLRLGGLNANLIFRNNEKGTHEHDEKTEVSIVIVPKNSPVEFPKPPPLGGAGGNPHIFFVFTDGDGEPVSDEFYLGRCVQLSK